MTRPLIVAGLLLALLAGAYALGRSHEADQWRADLAEAREAAREASAKLEAQRLAVEAERAALLQSLEDAAYAAPVSAPACLPADRVRRLDRLR
ncbi:MAG: hypothetical protein MUF14_09885 [Hyphomonadaceae bacterium]|nr:hypothetical protein [Hyphomonadaceae bacterium]